MEQLTIKEKTSLTVQALNKRREDREKKKQNGLNEAALFRKEGLRNNIARKNRKYY